VLAPRSAGRLHVTAIPIEKSSAEDLPEPKAVTNDSASNHFRNEFVDFKESGVF
jgi:hypothetical protein